MSASSDRTMLERLRCIALEVNPITFRIEAVSPTVREILGYDVDECREPDFILHRLVFSGDTEYVATRLMEVFESRRVDFSFRGVRRDGSTVSMRAVVALGPEQEAGAPRLDVLLCEVSAVAESASSTEERLQLALESADMGVWDWNLSEWTIFWSDQVYRLHGTTREEVRDLFASYDKLIDRVHPEDRQTIEQTVRHSLRTGEDYELEYRYELPDGTYRWMSVQGRIYFDDEQPVRIAGTAQDITARKVAEIAAGRELAERRRAEAELKELTETLEERVHERTLELERANARLTQEVRERARAERKLARVNRRLTQSNKELQNFAYVASHDLREPLRKIRTFADLLRCDFDDALDEEALFYIDRMQASAERMTSLIQDLLQFSRVETAGRPFATVDLNRIVLDVLADLEVAIEETGASVRAGSLPSIEADPTQMRQLFQNLISNALKFRREDVPPVVEVETEAVPEDRELVREGYRVTVKDNGIGLNEQYADRIFAPFQRLHPEYDGTGMGLAICRRIVERHHGTITVSSTVGTGSTFIVDLPRHQMNAFDEVREDGDAA